MNNDLDRPSDLTGAMTVIKAQTDLLTAAIKDNSHWKIEFAVEMNPQTLDIRVTAMKPHGGGGVAKTLLKEDVLYYQNDPSSLIESVAEEIYVALLKDQIKNELGPQLTRAINVVAHIENKTGSSL